MVVLIHEFHARINRESNGKAASSILHLFRTAKKRASWQPHRLQLIELHDPEHGRGNASNNSLLALIYQSWVKKHYHYSNCNQNNENYYLDMNIL